MKVEGYEKAALFEHRFWLQVLGDHARFILNALSPKEEEGIHKAHYFIGVFDGLLEKARKPLSEKELDELNQQANFHTQEIRFFKLDLIQQHLVGDIEIGLPPTFINHMVNEAEEYLKVLCFLLAEQTPAIHPIFLHMAWLLDAAGHAAGISGDLDMTEKRLREESETFIKHFEEFYIKAVEMAGYTRTGVDEFPALKRFNKQVEREIILFKGFLRELEKLELDNKVLGTLSALMLDHMAREECYYLTKLAEVARTEVPLCDPTKPRTEC